MLDVAIDAAKQAGELALKYFKSQPKVSYKADKSPVTRADIEAEKLIRKILSKNFPDHGIIGEELPPVNPGARYQWVIDPIDGTRDFIRRIPYWAVFVALMDNRKPIISTINFPAVGTIITAQKHKGTLLDGKKAIVSKTQTVEDAYISYGSLKRFLEKGQGKNLGNLISKISAPRSYANLGFIYFLEGKIDILIEATGAIHDFAAPALAAEEAGGKFTDFNGLYSFNSGNGVFTNNLLHSQVLKLLNS